MRYSIYDPSNVIRTDENSYNLPERNITTENLCNHIAIVMITTEVVP
ncbi:MAG: hypothetical protein WBA22_08555 [Candidatus Methanofastidiosia archaeon]